MSLLSGCAGGPTHDYYSPAVNGGPKFKGPITMSLVEEVQVEKQKCLIAGYTLIGTSDYSGIYPEASELKAQARRAHANHVIYSVRDVSKPGSWHFSFGSWGGGGGTGGDNEVHIIFMGK
jgi:hypothetical protein